MLVPRRIVDRGIGVYDNDAVQLTSGDNSRVTAIVRGSANYRVTLAREAKRISASCTCPYFDTDGVCKHIWATLLEAEDWGYLSGDGDSSPTRIVASRVGARNGNAD